MENECEYREEPVIVRDFETSAHFLVEFLCSDQSKTFRYPQGLLYRGEASEEYTLVPSALRQNAQERFVRLVRGAGLIFSDTKQVEEEHAHIEGEYALMRYFYRKANKQGLHLPPIPYIWHERLQRQPSPWMPTSEKEWIPKELAEIAALMQHYGFPTRMLDWTSNILTALYFAANGAAKRMREGNADKSDHMVIWVLRRPLGVLDEEFPNQAFPVKFITPSYAHNPNINAQQGVLSYIPASPFSREKDKYRMPLDEYLKSYYNDSDHICMQTVLTKARIPIMNYKHTLQILSSFGVNSSTVFPGYSGIFNQLEEESHDVR